MIKKYFTYLKTHYKLICSFIWILILINFWQNIYYSSNIILNDVRENKVIFTVLFFLQGISFALPVITFSTFKKILGNNNIVHKTYSEEKIAKSRFLSALNNLLYGESLLLFVFIASIGIYYLSPEYGHNFFSALNYCFIHSFLAILLFDHNVNLLGISVIAYLILPDLIFTILYWISLILLFAFAIHFPYILGIILAAHFIWPRNL